MAHVRLSAKHVAAVGAATSARRDYARIAKTFGFTIVYAAQELTIGGRFKGTIQANRVT